MNKTFLLIAFLSFQLLFINCGSDDSGDSQEEEMEEVPLALNFTLTTSTTSLGNLFNSAGGMTASNSENTIYLSERIKGMESIKTYNVSTNTWNENIFDQGQFVTKRLHLLNDQLIVFGGQYVNNYTLPLNGDPVFSFFHDLKCTRFSSAHDNEDIYVLADIDDGTGNNTNRGDLLKYSPNATQFTTVTTLSEPRVYADAEIINNKYYLFGGTNNFINQSYSDYNDTGLEINLETGLITTFNLPATPFRTFTAKKENTIYVAYETRTDTDGDGDGSQDDRTINFGMYDTNSKVFTIIPHNLDDSDLYSTIFDLSILNNKLYVTYANQINSGPFEIKIFAAEL